MATLQQKSAVLRNLREFFHERGVMEVQTPLMYHAPVTDPFLKNFELAYQGKTHYLQTSPEYAMKRLLAEGSGPIYQICKAFRDEECGKIHSQEFTILEWYRPRFSEADLIAEVSDLMQQVLKCEPVEVVTYQSLFEEFLNLNPHQVKTSNLLDALNQQIELVGLDNPSRDDALMLLFSECIEPEIGHDKPIIVTDYPASQSALAKTKIVDGQSVAARFELYFKGIELANAYDEQNDSQLLRERFENDLAIRQELGLPQVPIDEELLKVTDQMPAGCGIALGVDRLMMLSSDSDCIADGVLNDTGPRGQAAG